MTWVLIMCAKFCCWILKAALQPSYLFYSSWNESLACLTGTYFGEGLLQKQVPLNCYKQIWAEQCCVDAWQISFHFPAAGKVQH